MLSGGERHDADEEREMGKVSDENKRKEKTRCGTEGVGVTRRETQRETAAHRMSHRRRKGRQTLERG